WHRKVPLSSTSNRSTIAFGQRIGLTSNVPKHFKTNTMISVEAVLFKVPTKKHPGRHAKSESIRMFIPLY
ncbi:MAG: hypothetical protein ACI84C_002923, partial [Flavobacteriales bacterium]